jgi:hypothetical protein
MTDREKLLTALLEESDRRVGAEVSVLDVIDMLEKLGAERRRVVHQEVVHTAA